MKIINKKNIFFFVILLIISIFVFVVFLSTPKSQATLGDKVYGYAWSSNIGWISFNSCANPDVSFPDCTGSTQDYGVTYNSSGVLSGYAWSPNIGWIKFGGLSGFPTGAGTTNANATVTTVNPNAGRFSGWARACAGTLNSSPNESLPGNCTSMTSRTDGWDGWISLSGTGYGVSFNPNTGNPEPSSYAWGSDVVGWIDFSNVKITPPIVNIKAAINSFTGPICVTNSDPNANYTWFTTGMKSCEIRKDGGASLADVYSIPTGNISSGNHTFSVNAPSSSSSYSLICIDNNDTTYTSDQLNSPVGPNVTNSQPSCTQNTINKKPKFIER